MKKTLLTLVIAMAFNVGYVVAADAKPAFPNPAKAIASQIYEMLGENNIPDEIRGSKAEVRVAVDRGNHLRILSVDTENEAMEDFVRSSIDFQKLGKGTYEKGIVYRIPIEVKK
ncbi:hypothetical protein [Pareuzebyella sediminis]|uniref:hypothetical protein n=1 Tax=Pareuzebyella sediminis TaxID=2607998 RepID=UPI0011ECA2D0|nr:hypothetical protein [Pareuzebyella sediminis]